jgi:hypothetical protein
MIYDIFQILLWVTAILLAITGIDDLYMDLLYWFLRGKYKSRLPDFSAMNEKEEKRIAIILGAWDEASVIGRTLSYAVRNLKYKNYRIFVGVYPNDAETIRIVKEVSMKDPRVIACVNPQNGPTTKADNLNSLYAGLCEYEKVYGEFDIMIVHDAEDFLHPNSLLLYNFLLGYKGYHAVQIPVIPIKSKLGKLYHRTYCDAFAEVHTKDMIVRQSMGTFIPFSGTGMGFHRKTMFYLEKYKNGDAPIYKNGEDPFVVDKLVDENGKEMEMTNTYFKNEEETTDDASFYYNDTNYHDDPFDSMSNRKKSYASTVSNTVKHFTFVFIICTLTGVGFLLYKGKSDMDIANGNKKGLIVSEVLAADKKSAGFLNEQSIEARSIVKEGYRDVFNNAVYLPLDDGKIGIQESSWGSEVAANDRLSSILSQSFAEGFTGFINKSSKGDEIEYKVIISNFDNIDEAHTGLILIRKLFDN